MARVGVFSVLKRAATEFGEDECSVRAAALAYYTVFALPPLLVLLITIAGLIWDPNDVRTAIEGQFAGMLGAQAGGQIKEMIASADRPDRGGALSTILSVAGLLFGATGAFMQLQGALNRAWGVKPDPHSGGVRRFVTKRLLSLGMVLVIGFLVAVSLALTAALSAFVGILGTGVPPSLLFALDLILAFAVLMALFALIFKVLPDATVQWRDVWIGAAVTAALFVVGKFAIGFYLGRGDKGDAFGAAGSLAVMLLWIYYAGMILLFGAEFTESWADAHGRRVKPEDGAVAVVEAERTVPPGGRTREGDAPSGRGSPARRSNAAPARPPAPAGAPSFLIALSLFLVRLRNRARS